MSKTVLINIRNGTFPPTTVAQGSHVVWRNLDPVPHSAETLRPAPFYFNAGAMHTGECSSPVLFSRTGVFPYLCRFHPGMEGTVTVVPKEVPVEDPGGHDHDHGNGHGHGFVHFHGFVTGGRSGSRFFMTHTPVLADYRHHFQVILQGSLTTPSHVAAYEAMRQSAYGHGKVQIFHDHLALPDIRDRAITELPSSSFEYYPNGEAAGEPVPGLEENIAVRIDKVLHFHQFEPDSDYPEGMAYIMYGDAEDVFIDHHITRAPNFHSVAKVVGKPDFWTGAEDTLKLLVPEKRIVDVSPKIINRVAFVDNAFHMFWLPPSGVHATPPQDPLIRRDGSAPLYEVQLAGGQVDHITIERFLHFDVRLLNHGVLIV